MPTTAIATDFHQWALDTAAALRERRFDGIDWEQVAEEIHSLGISEESQLEARLTQLMYHLLKMTYQPERKTASWERSVREQRKRIIRLLSKQPSLKPLLPESIEAAYGDVFTEATRENLPDSVVDQFPEECPYSLIDLLPSGD